MEIANVYERITDAIRESRAENNACTASDIARRLRLHKTWISPKLHDMKAAGLVTFTAMPGSIALVDNPAPVTAEDLGGHAPEPAPAPTPPPPPPAAARKPKTVPKRRGKPAPVKRKRLSQEELVVEEAKGEIRKQLSEKQIAHLVALNESQRLKREANLAAKAAAAPGQVYDD